MLVLFWVGGKETVVDRILITKWPGLPEKVASEIVRQISKQGPTLNDSKAGQITTSRPTGEEVAGNASWKQVTQMQGFPACPRTHLMVNYILLVLARKYTDASIRVARYHHLGVTLGSTVPYLSSFPRAYKTKEVLFTPQ